MKHKTIGHPCLTRLAHAFVVPAQYVCISNPWPNAYRYKNVDRRCLSRDLRKEERAGSFSCMSYNDFIAAYGHKAVKPWSRKETGGFHSAVPQQTSFRVAMLFLWNTVNARVNARIPIQGTLCYHVHSNNYNKVK